MKHLHLYAVIVELWLQLLVSFASGAPPCYVPVTNVRVKDVDTIEATVNLPFGVSLPDRTIRLDFDGLEVSRTRRGVVITDEEIAQGKKAKEELEYMLKCSEAVYVQPADRDGGFGRLSGGLWLKIKTDPKLLDVREWAETYGYIREEE